MDSERCLQAFSTTDLAGSLHAFRPRALTTLPGATVVAASHKVHLLDPWATERKAAAPAGVLFNPVLLTICVPFEHGFKVWDGSRGVVVDEFPDVVSADVSAFCFDARHRKLILACVDGSITVHNYLNGAVMKPAVAHGGEVSSLLYSTEDQVFITTSWDRSLRVHDEREVEECPTLRTVHGAHSSDIVCAAFSRPLGLIATAAAKLVNVRTPAPSHPARLDVTTPHRTLSSSGTFSLRPTTARA